MPAAPAPDVSVVVIAYNDAGRLGRAVRSVLDQSLANLEIIVVDDASTDTTHQVALELAAAHPEKVRAIRLPENSGGCSRPRNVGVEHARGTYVMFLDSDDTLERHACKNMLAAAEETGADLVSGLCVRLHVDRKGKRTHWYSHLYERRRVLESVSDEPDLFYDTLSTNKCYRREFLLENDLRFPEGLHYEDLLFSARAYLAARRITLIPNTVYVWHVLAHADERSISNQRDRIGNFEDRITIHRLIDELLLAHGDAELKLFKDVKFLQHDLVLYLWRLPLQDPAYRRRFFEVARDYLATIDPRAFLRAQIRPRAIAAYLLLHGEWDDDLGGPDWDALVPAIDLIRNRKTVAGGPLARRGDRVVWGTRHQDTPLGRELFDVTELGLHAPDLTTHQLAMRVDAPRWDGRALHLSGEIDNPLGLIPAGVTPAAALRLRPRRAVAARRRSAEVPVRFTTASGPVLRWTASFDPVAVVHPIGLVDPVWDIRLRLRAGEVTSTGLLFLTEATAEDISIPVTPTLSRLTADRLEPLVTPLGHLALTLGREGRAARQGHALIMRAATSPAAATAVRTAKRQITLAKRTRRQIERKTLTRLPLRPGTVVFESHLGKQYSDSPKYIHEALRASGAPFEAIWSYSGSTAGFPRDVTLVKRGSREYYRALAQAEFWVDNQGFPGDAVKNPGTTYIQTWHGSALKRMGFDMPSVRRQSREQQDRLLALTSRFDHFVVRSQYDVDTLMAAYRLRAEPLRVGYPRNDALVDPSRVEAEVKALRDRLGLTDGRRVVLYAPTFREATQDGETEFEMPFDVREFARRFGDDHVLLVRTHYLDEVTLPADLRDHVRDASGVHDVTLLLLLTDVLITDYSSLMFDFALLDRPMVFYTYDYDAYTGSDRGAYFDLASEAPGPLAHTESALFDAVAALAGGGGADGDETYRERRRDFTRRYGEYDRGTAAQAIVDRFFLRGGEGGAR